MNAVVLREGSGTASDEKMLADCGGVLVDCRKEDQQKSNSGYGGPEVREAAKV